MESYTLSIDNIVLDLWISNNDFEEILKATINSLNGNAGIDIVSWEGNRSGTFLKQYLFKLENETSFYGSHIYLQNTSLV